MIEKLHIFICVLVALIVTVFGVLTNLSLYDLGVRLILAIIVFYFLGIIAREYLKKAVFAEKTTDAEEVDAPVEELKPEEADVQ